VKGLKLLLGRDGESLLELLDGEREELRELLQLRGGPLGIRVGGGLIDSSSQGSQPHPCENLR
jgi:hypothetical protein